MRLQRLRLPEFRNLREFEIVFDSHFSPVANALADTFKPMQTPPIRSHALIGQNGTGKSNLIEALVTIFRDLDLERPQAPFDYELEYSIRGHSVRILAERATQKLPFVWLDGKQESQGFLVRHAREYLPWVRFF